MDLILVTTKTTLWLFVRVLKRTMNYRAETAVNLAWLSQCKAFWPGGTCWDIIHELLLLYSLFWLAERQRRLAKEGPTSASHVFKETVSSSHRFTGGKKGRESMGKFPRSYDHPGRYVYLD